MKGKWDIVLGVLIFVLILKAWDRDEPPEASGDTRSSIAVPLRAGSVGGQMYPSPDMDQATFDDHQSAFLEWLASRGDVVTFHNPGDPRKLVYQCQLKDGTLPAPNAGP